METVVSFLEGASFYALFQQINALSTTEVVMVFLASKFCFVMMALVLLAVPPVRVRVAGLLATEATDPTGLLLEHQATALLTTDD